MKIASSLVLLVAAVAHGFAPLSRPLQRCSFVARRMADTSTEQSSDFASAMPDASDPYERLGVPKDNVALGMDANEILQWIGTRDEIIAMFMRDNNSFTQERAELEVDKFLMDAEMMSAYIIYQKKKDAGILPGEGEGNSPSFSTLLSWFAGFYFLSYLRRAYVDPKIESGEWTLPFGGGGGGGSEAVDAVTTSMAESTTQTLASVQHTIDTISDAM